MLIRNNRFGFGNDTYTTLYIRGNEVITAGVTDTIAIIRANGGYAHTGYSASGSNISKVTGEFGTGYKFIDGDSNTSLILLYNTDHPEDWMEIRDNDFTIDFWVYRNGYGTSAISTGIFSCVDGSPYGFIFYDDLATNKLTFYVIDPITSLTLTTILALPLDTTFRHIALSREGTSYYLFLDGIEQDNGVSSVSVVPATSRGLGIFYAAGVKATLDCAIDEIRISTGIARWTTNFIVPNRAY